MMAPQEGFEPPDLSQPTVFKTVAFNLSAIAAYMVFSTGVNQHALRHQYLKLERPPFRHENI